MKAFTQFTAILSIFLGAASAFAGPVIQPSLKEQTPVEKLSSAASEMLGRPLTAEESTALTSHLNKVEQASADASVVKAEWSDTSLEPYACIGVKVAVIVLAGQALKCINLFNGSLVWVTFGDDRTEPGVTGLAAPGYFGLNVGGALNFGTMIITRSTWEKQRLSGRYQAYDRKNLTGGLANGSLGWFGGLVGYWSNDKVSAALLTWQIGFSLEIAKSNLQIFEDDN